MSAAGLPAWAGVPVGLGADRLLGEPPAALHPVAAFGSAMTRLERATYRDHRAAGLVHLVCGVALAAAPAAGPQRLGAPRWATVAAATYLTVAGRALADAGATVAEALGRGDLGAARAALPALVGRDPAELDDAGVARAVVESLAENTVDAIVAPALWSLGGAAATLAYRAVNTLDAMVGHRSARYRRFGWAAARADDAANWVPARLCALLVAAVRPGRAGAVWRAVRHDAPAHPSPNAGVAEAAFAAALGVQLGGSASYGGRLEDRGRLGRGRAPDAADIARAAALSSDVTAALALLVVVAGVVVGRRPRGGRSR